MFENLEVQVKMSVELTSERIRQMEKSWTDLLGGVNKGYVEFQEVPEKQGVYVVRLRTR